MRLLLDTHLLLWAADFTGASTGRLSTEAVALINDPTHDVVFSTASIWEITIKHVQRKADFALNSHRLRRGLLDNGYEELPIRSQHALAVGALPDIHKDPFDRILIAQATVERINLLTSDAVVAAYPGPIRKV